MNNLICPQTGKPFNQFKGKINLEPIFNNATRYFIYENVALSFNEGLLDKENSTPMDDYNVLDLFPEIKVSIESPFSEEWGDPIVLKEKQMDQELEGKFNNQLGVFESDIISEIIDFAETKEVSFYELWLPTTYGKYRGYMKIDFDSIHNEKDLLDKVLELAIENYEFYSSPEELLEDQSIFINTYIPIVQKLEMDELDPDVLVSEMAYLLERSQHQVMVERLSEVKAQMSEQITLSDINNSVGKNSYFSEKGYNSLEDIINGEFNKYSHLKELGNDISNLFS